MSRYIDADALKESFRKQTVNVQGKIKDDADAIIEAICKDVDLAPTVDAVPVEWIKTYIKRTENNGNTFAAVQYEMMLWDYLADCERRSDEQQ